NIWADKQVVLADGETYTLVTIQVENPVMDIRQAVEANIFVGGEADAGAMIAWIANYEGDVAPNPADPGLELVWDDLNPTSVRVVTSPITGRAYLLLKSSEAGMAEVTVTGGQAYVCDKSRRNVDYQCNIENECIEVYSFYNCHYTKNKDLDPGVTLVEFLAVTDNEIYLNTGWNFISTPYALDEPDAVDVFDGLDVQVAYGWDANAQSWDLLVPGDTIEPLEGYWVKMNSPGVLAFEYDYPAFPEIPTKEVKPGWNAVGLTWNTPMSAMNALISITSSYSQLIGWMASLQSYDLPVANTGGMGPLETGGYEMQPKSGYWIWVTSGDDLAGLTALSN
ncbi:MAG: hypothetical protein KAJ19_09705, partial [Gammaproteobacteria bacterium]|nr:hypothetical protein [Gammaproteobacteria bacterium]